MRKINATALLAAGLLCSYHSSHAQILKNIGKKIERKAEKALDKTIDNALDGSTEDAEAATTEAAANSGLGPFKNLPEMAYDFKAGNEVIFFDNFSDDSIGSMASHWTSNGRGSIADVPEFDGRWLRMYDENTYKIKDLVRIPENFTLEFDLLTLADSNDDIVIEFGFDHQKGIGKHYYLGDRNPINIEASYRFDQFDFTSNELSQRKSSEVEADMSYFVNDVMNVQLRVQSDRMEVYINTYKVLDTEMVNPATKKYFYMAVNDDTNRAGIYLGNVRITKL